MKRKTLNFLIDALAFSAFVLLTSTGVLVRYVLPPGSGRFTTIWGLDRHDWGQIHFWIALVLLSTLGGHLFLHWRWVVGIIKGKPSEGSGIRAALALVGLLGLVGLALSPFFATVEPTGGEPPHKLRSIKERTQETHQVYGSMTLREVEQVTGVSIEEILRELGLPPNIPADERLGRLRRIYRFEIEEVRKIVRRDAEKR